MKMEGLSSLGERSLRGGSLKRPGLELALASSKLLLVLCILRFGWGLGFRGPEP